jgi:hypothetical protein
MKISTEKPPIYDKLAAKFPIDWDNGVIITYGDTVYCKSGTLSPDLEVHEAVHIEQQKNVGPDEWVDQFLNDRNFRMKQEVEAYRAQSEFIFKNIQNVYRRIELLDHLRRSLVKYYDLGITYQEASKLLPYKRK